MEPDRQRRYPVDAGVPATLHRGASRRANHRTDRGRQLVRWGQVHSVRDARRYGRGRADPPYGVEGMSRKLPTFGTGRVAIGHLITHKDQMNGIFQPVIPAMDSRFRGNDGLSRDLFPGLHRPGLGTRVLCVIRIGQPGGRARRSLRPGANQG